MKPTERPSGADEEPLFLHEDRSPQFEIDPSQDLFEDVAVPDEGAHATAPYDTWREIPADDPSSRVIPQTVERWADEESRQFGSRSRLALLLALIVAVIAAGTARWAGFLGPRANPGTMVADAGRAAAAPLPTPAESPATTTAPDVRTAAPNAPAPSTAGTGGADLQLPVLTPAEREALEALLSTKPLPSAAAGAAPAPPPPTPTAAPVTPSPGVAPVSPSVRPVATAPSASSTIPAPPGYVPYVPAPLIPDPPPAPRPASPPAAVPVPASLPTDEVRLRALMDRYRAAFASLDVTQVRSVWPTVDARALSRAFSQIESQQFEFAGCEITVSGDRGTAGCSGNAEYVTRIGSKTQRVDAREWTFQFQRVDQDWRIASVVTR